MVESRWQDKVKILQWHDELAWQAGIHRVCGAAHAQELVVHWMTTGSLNYPFALTRSDREPKSRRLTPKLPPDVDTRAGNQIGELAIHRESIQRILLESPHSLTAILDALLSALQPGQPRKRVLAEQEPEVFCRVEQEVF
jgi:hypothetical protein